jgi:hypothetical protein
LGEEVEAIFLLTSACIEKRKPNRSPFLYFEHQISCFEWSFVSGSKINSLTTGLLSFFNMKFFLLNSSVKQGKMSHYLISKHIERYDIENIVKIINR